MVREIEINGKKFLGAEITFGTVRKLQRMGVDFGNLGNDVFTLVSAYVRVSTNMSEAAADKLIQDHILAGGSFDEIVEVFSKAVEESDFFQALAKTEETATE